MNAVEKTDISVIIPVYNAEKYLAECINSVICQTADKMEIICVNDGSTDKSGDILNEFAKVDRRIIIVNQINQGAAAARNKGIDKASGEFIYFIDSDDYLMESTALESMINYMQKDDLDIILFGAVSKYESKELEKKYPYYREAYNRRINNNMVMNGKEALRKLIISKGAFCQPCMMLLRKAILFDNNIRYITGITYEDEPFFLDVMYGAGRVRCLDKKYYCRRVREGSVMTTLDKGANDFISGWRVYKEQKNKLNNLEDNYSQYIIAIDLFRRIFQLRNAWNNMVDFGMFKQMRIILSTLSPKDQIQLVFMGINLQYSLNGRLACFPYEDIQRGSKIVLYGAGNIGKMFFSQIISTKYCEIVAWTDTNYDVVRKKVDILIPPDEILGIDYDYVLISVESENGNKNIREHLISMGVENRKIIWFPVSYMWCK